MDFDEKNLVDNVVKRFITYCEIDSGSDQANKNTPELPTSNEQKVFAQYLINEAKEMGYQVDLMPFGVRIRANATKGLEHVDPLLFGAHIDTSPDAPTKGVEVLVHENYQGQPIMLQNGVTLTTKEFDSLSKHIGDTIFTSNGTTLLGGDDKSGVAALMTFLEYLNISQAAHGEIDVMLTFDEEVGLLGAQKIVPMKDTNAKFGFTFDGAYGTLGIDTFNAAAALLPITRINNSVSGTKACIEIAGIYTFPGHGKENGMIDAFRNIPEVVEYLDSQKIKVIGIDKNAVTGCVDLEVILEDGQNLDGLANIKDLRFSDERANNPIKYLIGEKNSSEFYYDLSSLVQLVNAIPYNMTAEQSEGYEGYMQPILFTNRNGAWTLYTILRDFTVEGLEKQKQRVGTVPGIEIEDEYKNMAEKLKKNPHVPEIAQKAMIEAGVVEIKKDPTRGGNEASTYTFAGIPSANIGALGDGCHSVKEYLPQKALTHALFTAIHINHAVVNKEYTN